MRDPFTPRGAHRPLTAALAASLAAGLAATVVAAPAVAAGDGSRAERQAAREAAAAIAELERLGFLVPSSLGAAEADDDGEGRKGKRKRAARVAEPGSVTGGRVVKTGWWYVANEPPPDTGVLAAPKPPTPNVPAGALPVGAVLGETERVSALEFAIDAGPGASVESFELALRETATPGATAGTELAAVSACQVTEDFWADGEAAAWNARPAFDCEAGKVDGVRDEAGTWRFDLTALAAEWAAEDSALSPSVVLVEQVEAPASFQLAFDGPKLDGVGLLVRATAAATEDGEDDGATDGGGSDGVTSVDGNDSGGFGSDGGSSSAPLGSSDPAAIDPGAAPTDDGMTMPTTEEGTVQAGTLPVAAGLRSWWGGLPWVVWALVPFALALAYLVMLALGPDGRPTPGGGRAPRGVGRALASVRRLQAAAPTKTGAGR